MASIDKVEKLLKNELAAAETYHQALEKFEEENQRREIAYLEPIYEEHTEAVSELQEKIQQMGGTPTSDSGLWGSWSEAVMSGAELLGKDAMLNALLAGEKSGLDDYEQASQDPEMPSEVSALIQAKFVTSQQENIRALNRLLSG
ncbi:DUF2383 domain-containing protein [Methylobacter sp. YRD-M1]|uniref:DUF2383 domain-containing protein n=1 Tax=Methylobacter sp. YRD-M1 TaxID=2911520 RepID=UPI00227BF7D4|nr:DUF2383 domain-containing protein [Methylobacter sp. YRD-M1]WAK03911.1 PA2169 family four-helix-bundle protein [Methylobacter sp. YRD-M1]